MPKNLTLNQRESRLAFWMLAPTVMVVATLVCFPIVWNLWLSVKPVLLKDLRGDSLFTLNITLKNFHKVFTDPEIIPVLVTTLSYTIGGSFLSLLLGLAAALFVRENFPGRGFLRVLFIAPYITPIVAATFTWSFILDPQLGVFNWFAMESGILDRPIPFFSQRWWTFSLSGFDFRLPLALTSVIFFEGWRYFPFTFLFILARLQAIPDELYHAASVDGASPFQRFFNITLPQLKIVLATLFLFRFIWTLNKFDDVFLLTRGQSGTKVLTVMIYDYAFGEFNIGASSAAALALFAILSIFLIFYFSLIMKDQ